MNWNIMFDLHFSDPSLRDCDTGSVQPLACEILPRLDNGYFGCFNLMSRAVAKLTIDLIALSWKMIVSKEFIIQFQYNGSVRISRTWINIGINIYSWSLWMGFVLVVLWCMEFWQFISLCLSHWCWNYTSLFEMNCIPITHTWVVSARYIHCGFALSEGQ